MADISLPLIPQIPKEPLVMRDPVSQEYITHPSWIHYHSQLNSILQTLLSHEGIKITRQPTDFINTNLNTTKSNGNFLYDSILGVMKVNNQVGNSTNENMYKEIYTRPEQLTASQVSSIPTAQINGKWVFETDSGKLKYGINNVFREVAYT